MNRPSLLRSLHSVLVLAVISSGGLAVTDVHAAGRDLIRNGRFQTGNLAGWKISTSEGGLLGNCFNSGVGNPTPMTNSPTPSNPQGGTRHAVFDQTGASFQTMTQKFRMPRKFKRVILSYQMFVQSQAAVVLNPAGFDLTNANQQARVDLLSGSAATLSTSAGLIRRLYAKGADVVPPVTLAPYKSYRINITRSVRKRKFYQLRFGAIGKADTINLGVDNVSVKVY